MANAASRNSHSGWIKFSRAGQNNNIFHRFSYFAVAADSLGRPCTANASHELLAAKFTSSNTRLWHAGMAEQRYHVHMNHNPMVVDVNGNVYLGHGWNATDAPDVLHRLSSAGTISWSRHLGGADCGPIALAPDGGIYLAYTPPGEAVSKLYHVTSSGSMSEYYTTNSIIKGLTWNHDRLVITGTESSDYPAGAY